MRKNFVKIDVVIFGMMGTQKLTNATDFERQEKYIEKIRFREVKYIW